MLDQEQCRQARLSRDRRFDGLFFVGVKTTGVYCRPICPVRPPLEKNVLYFPSAIAAANAGFRPCLRCRPDSAPGSAAWQGTFTTLQRALRLIQDGALQQGDLPALAERLGVSDRYLRQLFERELGISPKQYALYQQSLFAKKLLHETKLPITDIALASGFHSLRRFNDCFQRQFQLTPRAVRKSNGEAGGGIHLFLASRPPYHWPLLQRFLVARLIPGLEWCDELSYGRSFRIGTAQGHFTATFDAERCGFDIALEIDDLQHLAGAVQTIRRVLDLDADIALIESSIAAVFSVSQLSNKGPSNSGLPNSGLRLPGIWDPFEAGVRAILGQQVSVAAARNLVQQVVQAFHPGDVDSLHYFPQPEQLAQSDLDFLRMPGARKATLRAFAERAALQRIGDDPAALQGIKGVGPWTIDYIRMRGLSDPDVFLAKDLGVMKALAQCEHRIDPDAAAPWRSYLTFHLWNRL
ncbi:MAG TPA: Ada metal-binding domain-containing protein [Dongiaceae bacterium]|nr:Ada metal-binding domain-containing protein [Dongiaceae bacterium]